MLEAPGLRPLYYDDVMCAIMFPKYNKQEMLLPTNDALQLHSKCVHSLVQKIWGNSEKKIGKKIPKIFFTYEEIYFK